MNYIVDKNGKELNGKSNHKKRSWISQNMIAALTMIPIAGAMVNFIVKLYIYIYKMGYSSYFQIPNEYLLINYNITIYNMIIVGSISVVYCMCAVNNVRIILRREMLIKKIFWGILLDFLIPVLICFIILSIATGNWEDALIVLQEEQRKCIILVLFIIFSNAIIVFAVGYCMVYSFQKDLIEKNRRNKRKEPKKNLSRKHKYRWKNKDYQLIGWLLIIVAIVSYGAYVNWQGIQNAQKQELFLYNMFFKKECFAQEQEYRMVFLCVHKREHQVPENSIPVEYRIKDEVFIPFIRMKLGDISCLKSVCVGTKNTSDLAVKGLRHYFGSRNLEVRVRKSEIPLRY